MHTDREAGEKLNRKEMSHKQIVTRGQKVMPAAKPTSDCIHRAFNTSQVSFPRRAFRTAPLVACGSTLLLCAGVHAQHKPTIEVASASYGLNITERALGNATKYIKSACDGKRSCNFAVKVVANAISDSALGKSNDFDFVYRCGDNVKRRHIDGDSTKKIVLLTCAD